MRLCLVDRGFELAETLFPGIEVGEIRDHLFRKRRKIGNRDGIFPSGGPQREEPLFNALQFARIEFRAAQRGLHFHLRGRQRVQCRAKQLYRLFEQSRGLLALALQPAHQGCDMRHRRRIAIQEFGGLGDISCNPFGFLHGRAPLGKIVLFAVERRQRFKLLDRGAQIVSLARGSLDLRLVGLEGTLCVPPAAIAFAEIDRFVGEPRKGVEQHPVGVGIDQRPVIVLAMDFDQQLPHLAHQLHADGLVVDIGTGAAVGGLNAAEDQVAIVVDAIALQQRSGRMAVTDVEDGGHLSLVLAVAHKRTVAAPT